MVYTDKVVVPRHNDAVREVFSWHHVRAGDIAQVPIKAASTPDAAIESAKKFFYSIIKSSECILNTEITEETDDYFKVSVRIMD